MFENLTFVQYRDQYANNPSSHVLLDVRTMSEYASGHVPGAINIPLDQLPYRIAEVDRSKPVIVICASGNRSQTGARVLKQAGFDQVYNFQGGTMVWMMNGLRLDY